MRFTEKLLHCYNCKKSFVFTVEAQESRTSQGYPNDPTNCPTCHRTRKTRLTSYGSKDENYNSHRQMFPVTCTQCGKATRVPFQPRQGKPIYCIDCQLKTRVSR
jgi:CxxC-x17-CxxC domain-containing protein